MNRDDLPLKLAAIFDNLPPSSDLLYVLDEHDQPQPCDDVLEWALWMEEHRLTRHVAEDYVGDGDQRVRVSTIFLGMNMRHFGEPPLLWETMVFVESSQDPVVSALDLKGERYASLEAAVAGHQEMCRRVNATIRLSGGR